MESNVAWAELALKSKVPIGAREGGPEQFELHIITVKPPYWLLLGTRRRVRSFTFNSTSF